MMQFVITFRVRPIGARSLECSATLVSLIAFNPSFRPRKSRSSINGGHSILRPRASSQKLLAFTGLQMITAV